MGNRNNSHTISHAENLFSGDAYQAGANSSGRGLPIRLTLDDNLGQPDALDANGYAAAQAVAAAGNLTLNGALVVAGIGVADVARNVQILSTNAGDTAQTATITGRDAYDAPVVERLVFNGTTPVSGSKSFKQVESIAISAALTGNASAGTEDEVGLSYRVDDADDVDSAIEGGNAKVIGVGAGAITVADTTSPATAVTGDVRGTFNPSAAADGTDELKLVYKPAGRNTVGAFGVPQFAG